MQNDLDTSEYPNKDKYLKEIKEKEKDNEKEKVSKLI